MSIKFKLSLLITFLFLTAILNSGFTFWLEKLGEEKSFWVSHTNEVLRTEASLMNAMTDMETGQRGYMLTGKSSYLQPYHNGFAKAKKDFLKLKSLTSDNPSQQNILNEVNQLMNLKFDELAETILLAQGGEKDAALKIIMDDMGRDYMDRIRYLMTSFNKNELILLEQRKGDFREHRAKFITLFFVQISFFLGLALVTFLFLKKSLFTPLRLLVKNAEKVERGEKLVVTDILEKDEMGHLLSSFYEMGTKVYSREQTLKHEVMHDNLTGLKNRSTVLQVLEESIYNSEKSNNKVAVLFLDLDSFKQINDTLGHNVGDLVLKETALRLKASIRGTDDLFRLGGDEFLIILNNIGEIGNAIEIVKKIQNSFKVPVKLDEGSIELSVSIGISLSPNDSVKSVELIEFADIAMYTSKQEGSGEYRTFKKNMVTEMDYEKLIKNL